MKKQKEQTALKAVIDYVKGRGFAYTEHMPAGRPSILTGQPLASPAGRMGAYAIELRESEGMLLYSALALQVDMARKDAQPLPAPERRFPAAFVTEYVTCTQVERNGVTCLEGTCKPGDDAFEQLFDMVPSALVFMFTEKNENEETEDEQEDK